MRYRDFKCMYSKFGLRVPSLWVAFAALFFVLGFLLCTPTYAADGQGETSILVSSSVPGSAVRFVQDVEDGLLSLEKDVNFKVKAFVEPVTVTEEGIYAQRELSIPEREFVCQEWPCSKTWDFDFSDQPVSVSEFPRLQIDWSQAGFGATPEIHVEAFITPGGDDGDDIRLLGYFNKKDEALFRPVKTLDMTAAEYVEKSTWYLAKRELGFKADERWRYDQDGENLVLQARVDLPLDEVDAVQVFFNPKKVQELGEIQFSVDSDGNGMRDAFILYGQTKHDLKKKDNGSVLTVDLRGAITKQGIDPEKAVLQEPVIFLPTNFPSYERAMPIQKIVFGSFDRTEDVEVFVPEVEQKDGQYSLEFDFSNALEDLSIWDARLDSLKITVDLDGPQVVMWDRVRVFDAWETQVPILSKEPGKALRDWIRQKDEEDLPGSLGQIKGFRPLWIQSCRIDRDLKGVIPTMGDVEMALWSSEDNKVRGSVYSWISGGMDNSVIRGEITIEGQQETKTAPVTLLPGFNSLRPLVQNGARIKDLKIKAPIYMDQEALSLDVALFDVKESASGEAVDYRSAEWWVKGEELSFSLQGKNFSPDTKKGKMLVFPKDHGKSRYSYAPVVPEENFILPFEFILPGQLPQPCVATLKINDRKREIPYGPYTLSLLSFGPVSGEVEFTIEYLGGKQIIEVPIPRIKVMGLRHTSEDELKKIGVLIDDKSVGLGVTNVPAPEGEWVDMGSVTVGEGEHAIQIEESRYFRIKTLLLETDTPLPWPQEAKEQVETTPFWKRVVLVGVKFLMVVAVLFVIYLFRSRVKAFLGAIFRPIRSLFSRTYWRLPDLGWTIVWAVLGVGLYGTGLAVMASGENYGFTFGGLAMVLVIWHLSRVLKKRFSERFPKAAQYIYRSGSTPFFAWAIGLLIVTSVLLVIKLDPVAEQVAVIVYYLLVVGVIGEMVSLRRSGVGSRGKTVASGQ